MKASTHIAYGHPRRITTPATNFLLPAVGALGLVVGLMALGAAPPAAAQPRYTITDLGTLGGSESRAFGINNLGQVAGASALTISPVPPHAPQTIHAFRTAPNSPINPATDDLGTVAGCESAAYAINNLSQVVGDGGGDACLGHPQAFRTAPNSPINPATDNLRVPADYSSARGINDSGQVVGFWCCDPNPSGDGPGPSHAWRTAPNSAFNPATDDLGTLGGCCSGASGINNLGQVVGGSNTASRRTHAFRTAPNSPINPATDDLGTLGDTSNASGINNLGQVVGYSFTTSGPPFVYHAFRTAPNSPINPATDDLGTLGGSSSTAFGINNLGQVVGESTTATGETHAFLYSGGVMYDLNTLIPPGRLLGSARAINDLGQIAATGPCPNSNPWACWLNGTERAYRLDPEPVVFVSSLHDLMMSFDLPNGISTELSALLRASRDAFQRGDNIAAQNQLRAFQNKVNAQRGKKLTATQADILLNAAVMAIHMAT